MIEIALEGMNYSTEGDEAISYPFGRNWIPFSMSYSAVSSR